MKSPTGISLGNRRFGYACPSSIPIPTSPPIGEMQMPDCPPTHPTAVYGTNTSGCTIWNKRLVRPRTPVRSVTIWEMPTPPWGKTRECPGPLTQPLQLRIMVSVHPFPANQKQLQEPIPSGQKLLPTPTTINHGWGWSWITEIAFGLKALP